MFNPATVFSVSGGDTEEKFAVTRIQAAIMLDEVLAYNAELKQFLTDIWAIVPKGRQKQFLKDPLKKALLDRYGIEYEE